MIKKLRIVEQKRTGMCGPAALRILLSYFKIDKSEEYLARLCQSSQKRGTHPKKIATALKQLGFKTSSGTWGGKERCWKNLNYWVNKRNLPVLVDWFSKIVGHYSVVIGLDRKNIWLADPEFHEKQRRIRKFSWNDFFLWWFDFEGEYIKRLRDLEVRWWLVAYPAPLMKRK